MSMHKSLKIKKFNKKKKRNVRKKHERFLKYMENVGKKKAYKNVFNLPKEKVIKFKVKKKEEKDTEETDNIV